jgi:hypothetical protein
LSVAFEAATPRVAQAFDGPLDIVGDVHGEIDALRQLLGHLGYDDEARHPEGRRLVFIGDLCDRGPDSPAVIEWVMAAVAAGRAQCLLGNHELLLLYGESRESLRWFLDPSHAELQPGGKYAHCRVAPPSRKAAYLEFFASRPLVLERADLRLVHAAWWPAAIEALREAGTASSLGLYQDAERRIEERLVVDGVAEREAQERVDYAQDLKDGTGRPPLLPGLAEANLRRNLDNPVRVLTFGPDRLATEPYYVMERWRMAERDPWWDRYTDDIPVIVGHYWRKFEPSSGTAGPAMPPAIDPRLPPSAWLGPKQNVYCVDFSVGARFVERGRGSTAFRTHLGAVRWPERRLVIETGAEVDLAG